MAVRIPVGVGKRVGAIDAAVISGRAPLLLGRPTLEKMNVVLDFGERKMRFLNQGTLVPMHTNSAGQLLIDVMDFPPRRSGLSSGQEPCSKGSSVKAMPLRVSEAEVCEVTCRQGEELVVQSAPVGPVETPSSCDLPEPEPPIPKPEYPLSSRNSTRRKVTLKKRECRCLLSQWNNSKHQQDCQIAVAELFSPPRLSEEARKHGASGVAFDIKQGCDLVDPQVQKEVDQLLDEARPKALTASPPCTYWGGWDHLNMCYRTPAERARLIRTARKQVKFCVEQIHKQLHRGGDFLLEHPLGSSIWKDPAVKELKRKYGLHKVDLCAFGLRSPKSGKHMRKSTGIICSKPEFVEQVRKCPGDHEHETVSGKQNCDSASQYPVQFVRAMWKCLVPPPKEPAASMIDWEALQCECLAGGRIPLARSSDDAAEGQVPAPPEGQEPELPDPQQDPETLKIDQALRKLHNNLGHPSSKDLMRILKHSNASQQALERVQYLQCQVCSNQQRPAAPLPANTSRTCQFNEKLGLDVKYLPGWNPGQKVACVNLVDYASSFQMMVPIGRRETGALLKQALSEKWVSWAGPPQILRLDPAQPNLGEMLSEFCSSHGISIEQTPADAHWQLGKVERHGQWFQRILSRVLDECRPSNEAEWQTCVVQTQSAKNTLISEQGASPYQYVFGRNPRVPTDLLQDSPDVAASEAVMADDGLQRANAVRQAARKSVLEVQDDRALRAALRARPRVARPFCSGDWVFYWRTQKSIEGHRIEGGRWYGTAMVLGHIGKNVVVAHRRSIMRCAPEQLRHATVEEREVAEFPHNELLGIKNLLEKGQFPKSQFEDLVPHPHPPLPDGDELMPVPAPPLNAAQCLQQAQQREAPAVPPADDSARVPEPRVVPSGSGPYPAGEAREPSSAASNPQYGPVRRVPRKTPANEIPLVLQPEDFADMMQEIVPQLIQEMPSQSEESSAAGHHSPREPAQKRPASREPSEEPGSAQRRPPPPGEAAEALLIDVEEYAPLRNSYVEVLIAGFLQKRMQKELPATNNMPEVQQQVDEAKVLEWDTVVGKQAVKVWRGAKARDIRKKMAHRFVGTRFVVTRKSDEEGTRIKARLCLQGHSDPDFHQKITSGLCHSPTLSQLGRSVLLQLMVSHHWTLNLGDVKGAFMEAGPLSDKFRPLYAYQPQGGIPGLHPDDVLEITGNLYGANDAPFQWYQTFDAEARKVGFQRSSFDSCLYFFRDSSNSLSGALGAHVDDTMTGGRGAEYDAAIAHLKSRFPYRKWRVGSGEFCGVVYAQNPHSFEISFQQSEYAKHIRPINMSKQRKTQKDSPATDKEVAALRAVNGAAGWLSGQSRPDLAAQTSFAQQAFPSPTVGSLLMAN